VLITTGVVLALVRPTIDFFQLVGHVDCSDHCGAGRIGSRILSQRICLAES
jgi:hypothetical protein